MQSFTKVIALSVVAGALTAGATERAESLVAGSVHGDIELVSFGIATISADRGPPLTTVHVREAFANRNDEFAWTVDASLATVWFGRGAPQRVLFANSDSPTLPLVRVARGERRIVDLYFPVPADRMTDEELGPFTVAYQVNTPTHRFEASATLVHSPHWPSREERAPEPGWARQWWADPSYPWTRYWRRPGHAVPRAPRELEIIHMPSAFFDVLQPMPGNVAEAWPRTDECNQW